MPITKVLTLASPMLVGAAHWAVIMAGSNTYKNYRHQADACHAFHIVKDNGIPESNIIVLAYDDIVNSAENPFPGKLFNKPNGPDVYAGCHIDYRGPNVTGNNFLKVLTGDETAGGKVLKSTSDDKVFVYYADHGGVGLLGVPDGCGPNIHAADVNEALESMYQKGLYKELLFYLEACESGSIFQDLLTAPKLKAVTAANAKESSYATYCPPSDQVQSKSINSCLGDEFSIHWMEDSDQGKLSTETIKEQIDIVIPLVTKSHVQQFGDATFDGEPIGNFQGASTSHLQLAGFERNGTNGLVNARDVELHLAYWQIQRAESSQERRTAEQKLVAAMAERAAADALFLNIAMAVVGEEALAKHMIDHRVSHISEVECHRSAIRATEHHCGFFTDYSMRHALLFANLCEQGVDEQTIVRALQTVCGESISV